ncbi:MAG: FliM/FliN family flagellar motor switch protein [Candidatus Margulisbacteria bacterium]|nr:FliM/FliN family flagellar motor switch protein [Candidatus Margulisiibacteriota bacterium]MBU1021180.1 FliM/FliN family flagellar motor switch protein [Candidatus Margulisiibacteriota bacterium]MBU1729786.1 FliM/FliN family flagellar motor switch protein [Candidatus Margulisiibacteriota bacterium]MBU1955287.1 FliM/FliN family flagellar motor switch protein [Candidatus Margulisiibacteriota bacterium]
MAEKQTIKSERAPHKKVIKLPPAIGDWTTYRPAKVYTKKIRSGLYGFDRLPEEDLDQLIKVHYDFITKLLHFFRVELKIGNELHEISGEQSDYLHFLRTSSGQIIQLKIAIPGYDDAGILLVDLSLVNTIINHMLGGKDTELFSRGLTELENEIFKSLLDKIGEFYVQAFDKIFKSAEITIVNSPDITVDPAINPTSSFFVFGMNIAFNDNPPAKITVGFPGTLVKGLLGKLQTKPSTKVLSLDKLPTAVINKLIIPITASIGETTISTSDLQALEVGDVISLEKTIDSPIEVKIGDKIILLGQPGRTDKKLNTRIVGLRHEEKVKIDPAIIEEEEREEIATKEPEQPAAIANEPEPPAKKVAPPPPKAEKPKISTLKDKLKTIRMEEEMPTTPKAPVKPKKDFLLEEKDKEEYPESEKIEDFEDFEDEDFDEDVLGEEDLNLDNFSLKDDDLKLDNFSINKLRGGPGKKKP